MIGLVIFDLSLTVLSHRQTVGLLVGTLIVAQRVTVGTLKASDFVFFITYLAQVRPLRFDWQFASDLLLPNSYTAR